MSKYLAPLKFKDILTLIVLIILGFGWIMIDQIFLKESYQRFIVFTIVMILLFQIQFWINRPRNIWLYSNTLSLISLTFVVISSIVMHIIIKHDFAAMVTHLIIFWIIAGILPYLGGIIYKSKPDRF